MTKRPLNPNEKRAWARVAKTVRSLPGTPPAIMPPLSDIAPEPSAGSPSPNTKTHPPPTFMPLQPDETRPAKSPVQNRSKERRIRRGQAEISATLDLHGHTQTSAHAALVSFLSAQRRAGAKCVLVITGKGKLGEGILRKQLMHWLETNEAKALVNGYSGAHQKHGGGGAWYLFLRKRAV